MIILILIISMIYKMDKSYQFIILEIIKYVDNSQMDLKHFVTMFIISKVNLKMIRLILRYLLHDYTNINKTRTNYGTLVSTLHLMAAINIILY